MVDIADGWFDDLGNFGHDRSIRDLLDRLRHDARGLAHLFDADHVSIVSIARLADWNIELEILVRSVRLRFPQIPFNARTAKRRAGHSEVNRILSGNDSDTARAADPNAVFRKQCFVLVDVLWKVPDERSHLVLETVVDFVLRSTDAKHMRFHTRAAVVFEYLQNFLPFAKRVQEHRHGADVERVGSEPQQMARYPVELGHNDANVLSAWRRLHAKQLLDRFAISEAVRNGGNVIHAVERGDVLAIGLRLSQFLNTAVQIPNYTLRIDDAL